MAQYKRAFHHGFYFARDRWRGLHRVSTDHGNLYAGSKIEKDAIKKKNDEVKQVRDRICSWAMLLGIIVAACFILLDEKAIARGFLLGTCFSIINFLLLGRSISITVGQSRPKASRTAITSIFLRYIVLAIPIIVAIRTASFNVAAAIAGIFAVQIVTLVYYIMIKPLLEGK